MKRNYSTIFLAALLLQACVAGSQRVRLPSTDELLTSTDINDFVSKMAVTVGSEKVHTFEAGSVIDIPLGKTNRTLHINGAMERLCRDRLKGDTFWAEDVYLDVPGRVLLKTGAHRKQALKTASQAYTSSTLKILKNGIRGMCTTYKDPTAFVKIFYAWNFVGEFKHDSSQTDLTHLIITKEAYFNPIKTSAIANFDKLAKEESKKWAERKQQLMREGAVMEAERKKMLAEMHEKNMHMLQAFRGARGERVCTDFKANYKRGTRIISQDATLHGFVEATSDTRVQVRFAGYQFKQPDPFNYRPYYNGTEIIPGILVWDDPGNWYFCRIK